MTQRKTILTHTSSVAFLIPACLSFAGASEAAGSNGFEVELAVVPLLFQGRLLSPRPTPWSTMGHERYEALNSMRQPPSDRKR
ncbi:MAG TPA: hypothetical protein VL486_11480 [Verrucomicrobiae bacterium]|nr:hypothetical protein [Verrucomicrobiae bacterium]